VKPSSILTGAAVFYLGFVWVKDGTIQKLIQDGANFLKDTATATRPITRVG
jgi:hypothetical protein